MAYEPKPIDTETVSLSADLNALVELLAESAHDHWATLRFSEGWTYGECRNDARKQHPCLVPYSDLPESEREYDRRTAVETLKAIVALGFEIRSPNRADREPPPEPRSCGPERGST